MYRSSRAHQQHSSYSHDYNEPPRSTPSQSAASRASAWGLSSHSRDQSNRYHLQNPAVTCDYGSVRPEYGLPTALRHSKPGNKRIVMSKNNIRPGSIIRAPVHTQDFRATSFGSEMTGAIDRHVTPSATYGNIYTKVRKMIVIACYHSHYISVPLFTHNGKGLQNKKAPDEYISVKDHRNPAPFKALSRNGILYTKELSMDVNLYEPATTAHATYIVSRAYNLQATPEGVLQDESLRKLIDICNRFAPTHSMIPLA